MRARIAQFVVVIQSILWLGHWFVFETWLFFWQPAAGRSTLRVAMACLSVSLLAATFLAFRSYHPLVRLLYILAVVWLGFFDFFFLAACLCWIVYPFLLLFGAPDARPALAATLFSLATLVGLCALLNAAWPRVRRVTVKLPGLPASWRGRVAAMLSDTHLGHVRGRRFLARLAANLQSLRPDVIFFPGDMFDGTKVDPDRLVASWKDVAPPLGIYFVTGNHEEMFDPTQFLAALDRSGVRVLRNEKVVVDGLQVVGVSYLDSNDATHFSGTLDRIGVDREVVSVLLLHVPHHLDVAERHGISLQLSGHTHGGQVFPFTLFVSRIFGKYAHGLQRFGAMSVFTSYGAGTWGPPMRLGTYPEIILIRFE